MEIRLECDSCQNTEICPAIHLGQTPPAVMPLIFNEVAQFNECYSARNVEVFAPVQSGEIRASEHVPGPAYYLIFGES